MHAVRINLRKEGLLKLLHGETLVLNDTSDLLHPVQVQLALHPEVKGMISTEVIKP